VVIRFPFDLTWLHGGKKETKGKLLRKMRDTTDNIVLAWGIVRRHQLTSAVGCAVPKETTAGTTLFRFSTAIGTDAPQPMVNL
jgi:hypothetical protein